MPKLEPAVQKGLLFIESQQRIDGSFLSLSSLSKTNFANAKTSQTIFIPSLILSALAALDSPKATEVKRCIAAFLLSQKSPHWTFNYWPKGSPESKSLPYPDDLDDTSCALAALWAYDPSVITGEVLAAAVKVLALAESKEGGPYRTWVVPEDADPGWQDVDVAVNFNVANFLASQGVRLPSLDKLAQQAITHRSFNSPYYPGELPVIYFLSRWYDGPERVKLRKYILSLLRNGKQKNPLSTALAITAMLNLEAPPEHLEKDLEYLLQTQDSDGSWPAYAFCLDPYSKGRPKYAGSRELTTALVIEALTKFAAAKPVRDSKEAHNEAAFAAVCDMVGQRVGGIKPSLQQPLKKALNQFIKSNLGYQVALLPFIFYNSLQPKRVTLNNSELVNLGAANIYGWVAYTIYDDFLDGEGDIQRLSAANLALRELTLLFYDFYKKHTKSWGMAKDILDGIDAANAWEVKNCQFKIEASKIYLTGLPRYGDLGQLAEKSFGHALGPLAISLSSGLGESSSDIRVLKNFFKHYLIARQLNDDAHDWADDLRRGRVNAVAAMLLEGHSLPVIVKVESLVSQLQERFWTQTITEVAGQIKNRLQKARDSLEKTDLIENPQALLKMLEPLQEAAEQSLSQQKITADFLLNLDK